MPLARPGRRRRGSPESEDLPVAANPNPSRKEDSCTGVSPCGSPSACGAPARSRGSRRARARARRRQDPDDLRRDRAALAPRRTRSTRSIGQPRRRVLLPRHDHVVRAVRRPDRPLPGRRLERLGLQGERRVAARRRRRGRRSRTATACSGTGPPFGADRRAADACRCTPRRSATATGSCAQDDNGKSDAARGASAARRRPPLPRRAHGQRVPHRPHQGLVRATLKGAVRSNAVA